MRYYDASQLTILGLIKIKKGRDIAQAEVEIINPAKTAEAEKRNAPTPDSIPQTAAAVNPGGDHAELPNLKWNMPTSFYR